MTHHNATFIALATDGEDCIVGIAENGEAALGTFDSLEWVARHIARNVAECIDADRPLIVVVGKNSTRATAGEVFLEAFALDIVRVALGKIPETTIGFLAGTPVEHANIYYHPRVTSTPLAWATKSTPVGKRVHRLLDELAFTDLGLQFVPQGKTHVGA